VRSSDQKRSQQDTSEFIGNSQMINEIEKNPEAFHLDPYSTSLMNTEHFDGFAELQRHGQPPTDQAEPEPDTPQNKMDIEEELRDHEQPPEPQDNPTLPN